MNNQPEFCKNPSNFKVLVSDGAAVCQSVGKEIKKQFDVKHVICLCHNLHNLAESIGEKMVALSEFMSILNVKWSNNEKFKDKWNTITSLPAYPEYTKTRWGTWSESAFFIKSNFYEIWLFLSKSPKWKKDFNINSTMKKRILNEFKWLSEGRNLPSLIKKLEKNGLTIKQQLDIYFAAGKDLKSKCLKDRFLEIQQKNPDLNFFITVANNIQDNRYCIYKYTNLKNANIERSFNVQKQFCTSFANNLSVERLFMRVITIHGHFVQNGEVGKFFIR